MNIVIPNADFSAVAIGKVDLNLPKVGDYNLYAAGESLYYYDSQHASIFNVTGCSQIYIKAVGRYGNNSNSTRPHCVFFSELPETNLGDQTKASAFYANKISNEIDSDAEVGVAYNFEGVVNIPNGAKCVMLQYLTDANYEKVCVKES